MSVLESSLVWAPAEAATQVCRNSQKLVAKEMPALATSAKALAAALPKEAAAASAQLTADSLPAKNKLQMIKTLQGMIKQVQTMKKKLDDAEKHASRHARTCLHRLHYLQQVDSLVSSAGRDKIEYDAASDAAALRDGEKEPISAMHQTRNSQEMDVDVGGEEEEERKQPPFTITPQLRLDRLFADHLLRNNRPQTASLLLSSSPALSTLVDPDLYQTARKIEQSLLVAHDCTRALAWCGENRSRLNKLQSTLEFDLRLQEFLALARADETMKAVEYARKHLAPAAITTVPATAAPASASSGGIVTEIQRSASVVTERAHQPSSAALQRNNSLPAPVEEKKDSNGSASAAEPTTMIADPARVRVLQEAMNLLVFSGMEVAGGAGGVLAASGAWARYRAYFSDDRWSALANAFRCDLLRMHGLSRESDLERALNIGLQSIKTSSCACPHAAQHFERVDGGKAHPSVQKEDRMDIDAGDSQPVPAPSSHSNGSNGSASNGSAAHATKPSPPFSSPSASSSCPACIPPLSCLASSLSLASRAQSRLVCRLTGRLMDDRNPPLALPNGSVYSQAALQAIAAKHGGYVVCPRTKEKFHISQARRVFVL